MFVSHIFSLHVLPCPGVDHIFACLDVIIEPLLYISDTHLGRVISQSNEIYIAGPYSESININMPQAGFDPQVVEGPIY